MFVWSNLTVPKTFFAHSAAVLHVYRLRSSGVAKNIYTINEQKPPEVGFFLLFGRTTSAEMSFLDEI